MRLLVRIGTLVLLFILSTEVRSQPVDYLAGCWHKQASPIKSRCVRLSFSETRHQLYHGFEPWQTYSRSVRGIMWSGTNGYAKLDSLTAASGRIYCAKTQYDSNSLYSIDFGDTSISASDSSSWMNERFESACYSPAILLDYIQKHSSECTTKTDSGIAIYTLTINRTFVALAIRESDSLLESVRILANNDFYGDVESQFHFQNYEKISGAYIPETIDIERVNGKIRDTVHITSVEIVSEPIALIPKPSPFVFVKEQVKKPELTVQTFNDHIHFIQLKHTDGQAMVVEFKDFVLVAEAPLTSANGELILDQVRAFAPNKPVRYFAFGHHHPDYLGGVRAFVHNGTTILSTRADIPYLTYLVSARHTIEPDSLQADPRALHTQEIQDSTTITDGNYRMNIYVIGKKSHHTNDYLIYYFPKEKLLFEDDLIWIPTTGAIKKASDRQAGLYHAIKDLGLVIDTIMQSWPLASYGVKTMIPFADLEASMVQN